MLLRGCTHNDRLKSDVNRKRSWQRNTCLGVTIPKNITNINSRFLQTLRTLTDMIEKSVFFEESVSSVAKSRFS